MRTEYGMLIKCYRQAEYEECVIQISFEVVVNVNVKVNVSVSAGFTDA